MPKKELKINHPSQRTYLLLLAAAVLIAVLMFIVTKGRLDLSMLGRSTSHPEDQIQNMGYGIIYRPSSDRILERDGILLRNMGNRLQAVEISSQIQLDAADISGRSSLPILRFSEYVGYFYLYDGQTVYRTNIDGSNVRAVVKNCLNYELMGNYLYSLKLYHGQRRLFRCSIIGTYEKMLFSEEVLDFWAYGGHLFMKLADGQYRYYNVLDGNSQYLVLPADAADITLCGEGILYLSEQGHPGRTSLYRRSFLTQEEIILAPEELASFSVSHFTFGPSGIGLLASGDEGITYAARCSTEGSQWQWYKEKSFPPDACLDMGNTFLFITENKGNTWYTALENENWQLIQR